MIPNLYMQQKITYKNGQVISVQRGARLIYYFKNGRIKAEGISVNNLMEGEWKFYPESGQLMQVGHFKNGKKNGKWIRFDKMSNWNMMKTSWRAKL